MMWMSLSSTRNPVCAMMWLSSRSRRCLTGCGVSRGCCALAPLGPRPSCSGSPVPPRGYAWPHETRPLGQPLGDESLHGRRSDLGLIASLAADAQRAFELRHLESPTPLNPPGAKGAGEGGITIEDTRAPFGARAERSPARRLTSTL